MSKNVIFPDTKEFDQKLAPEMKAKMDNILNPLGLNSVAIGSAHTPTPGEMSGDMDLQVDLDEVKAKFKTDDDKAARKSLAMFVQDRGFQVRQAGVNVFVRLPVGDEFYQVDLETIPNVAKVSRYHQHKIPKGSTYKGVGKQLMLAQLAKSRGYMYSAWQGLFARTPENKKGELVADEWDDTFEDDDEGGGGGAFGEEGEGEDGTGVGFRWMTLVRTSPDRALSPVRDNAD